MTGQVAGVVTKTHLRIWSTAEIKYPKGLYHHHARLRRFSKLTLSYHCCKLVSESESGCDRSWRLSHDFEGYAKEDILRQWGRPSYSSVSPALGRGRRRAYIQLEIRAKVHEPTNETPTHDLEISGYAPISSSWLTFCDSWRHSSCRGCQPRGTWCSEGEPTHARRSRTARMQIVHVLARRERLSWRVGDPNLESATHSNGRCQDCCALPGYSSASTSQERLSPGLLEDRRALRQEITTFSGKQDALHARQHSDLGMNMPEIAVELVTFRVVARGSKNYFE